MALQPELRVVTAEQIARIKKRTKQLIKLAGGPEVFQHAAGVPKDMLSKYCSLSEPNVIRADVVLALDAELEAPMMLAELAAMAGYRLVPAEDDSDEGDKVTLTDLADLHRADGDVAATLSEAMSDGIIDIAERRATRAAIDRKIRRLKAVDRKLARGG